jgi:DNA-directed RNA polymerase specialized sigma24 family protein
MEHRGAVFRTILARTMDPDAADEATAEAFARAYTHWDDTVAEHANPRAWILLRALEPVDQEPHHEHVVPSEDSKPSSP